MKHLSIRFLAAAASAVFAASAAFGAGYSLFEGSARGNVDAPRMIAEGGEPGTLYFNPAAITALTGTQVQVGMTAVMPTAKVETVNPYTGERTTTRGKEKTWPIPAAYVTHQLNGSLWLGLGVFSRFGLGAELRDTWPGRYNSYKAVIESVDVAPTLAWKVNEKLSVSLGLLVRYFDIELAQKIDVAGAAGLRNPNDPSPSPYDVDQNLHGDDVNFGVALGVEFKPVEQVSLGAAYHSRFRFVCHGDADWTKPAAVDAMLPGAFNDTRWRSTNYNPDEFMFGAAWHPAEKWTVSAGAVYTLWSVYEDLEVEFFSPQLMGRDRVQSDKKWSDVWRLMAGLGYKFTENWEVYGGYTFDQSPLNEDHIDYLVPADDRHLFGIGATWNHGAWTCDASYFYEVVADMDVKGRPAAGVFDGKFTDGRAHAVALSLTRRF